MPEPSDSTRIPITIEVTPEQKKHLEQLAEAKGLSQEDIVLTALNRELKTAGNGEESDEGRASDSFLEATKDLVGSIDNPDAPSDLASNPKHMEGCGR